MPANAWQVSYWGNAWRSLDGCRWRSLGRCLGPSFQPSMPHYCWCAVGALCFDVTSTGCRSYSSARCWPRNVGNAVRSGWLQLWAVIGSGLARYLGACWRVLEAFCRYSLKAKTGHIVHIFDVSLRIFRTRVCFQLRRRQSFWIYSSCLTARRLCGHEHGRYARLRT